MSDAKRAPAPRVEPREPRRAQVDSVRVLALGARLKKLMGAPEHVRMVISDTVEMHAEYAGGNIVLRDPEALVEASPRPLNFTAPFAVINAALNKRAHLTLELRQNQLHITGTRYEAELNIEKAGVPSDFEPIKGKDSTPFKRMLTEAGKLLQLRNLLENVAIDVHFKWDTEGIVAAAADQYHGLIVRGPSSARSAHEVTLPMDLAAKLAEIGGKFDIGENRVQAESATSRAEIKQLNANASLVPLETILSLQTVKPTWVAELNCVDLSALLHNLDAVIEWGQRIGFDIKSKTIKVDSNGRFGRVSGTVEINTVKGESPGRISVNPAVFWEIVSKVDGVIRLSLIGNIVKIEPVEQGEWHFTGFVHVVSNE